MTWYAMQALEAELQYIKGNADSVRLISSYAAADSYATVAANSVGGATIDDTDFGDILADGNDLVMEFSGKEGVVSASNEDNTLWVAILDTVNSIVLAVTDEESDQTVTIGNPIDFKPFSLRAKQPTQV